MCASLDSRELTSFFLPFPFSTVPVLSTTHGFHRLGEGNSLDESKLPRHGAADLPSLGQFLLATNVFHHAPAFDFWEGGEFFQRRSASFLAHRTQAAGQAPLAGSIRNRYRLGRRRREVERALMGLEMSAIEWSGDTNATFETGYEFAKETWEQTFAHQCQEDNGDNADDGDDKEEEEEEEERDYDILGLGIVALNGTEDFPRPRSLL
ncbi:hypothetical protein PG988_008668 [Apiospora saccharicola]